MKKILTILLCAVMAAVLAISVNAEVTTYTITIDNTASGHTYEAYQIFTGDLSNDGKNDVLSNIKWGDGVNGDALLAALKADAAIGGKFTDSENAADVAKVLEENNSIIEAFAKIVGANLSDTVAGTSTAGTDNYTITGLAAGYYLVKDKDDTQTGEYDSYTRYIVEVVKSVTVSHKGTVPTVEKKIIEGDTPVNVADYNIGDTVTFRLTGTLPDNLDDYSTYKYVFHDTMSAGLTYDLNSYKVMVGNIVVNGFSLNVNGQELTFTCDNLKAISGLTLESKIEVTYTAKLNSSAVIGSAGNPNNVYLEFSNNPNGEGTGKTPKDYVIVFTYELDVTKVDGETTTKTLEGAKFVLYKGTGDNKNYATIANGKITDWKATEASASTLTSGTDGTFNVIGLDEGIYYLEETDSPTGYNLLEKPITLKIEATKGDKYNGTTSPLTDLTISVDDGTAAEGTLSSGIVAVTVKNNAGSTLPSTGGIGTTIFTVVGVTLCIGAAVLLIAKRKMSGGK